MPLVVSLRLAWRTIIRKPSRTLTLIALIAVGVATLTAVRGLSSGMQAAISQDARSVLGGDLEVVFPRERTEAMEAALAKLEGDGALLTVVRTLPVTLTAGGRRTLVEVKVVDPERYPWFGPPVTGHVENLRYGLGDRRIVVAPRLLERLGLKKGDKVKLADREFAISGTVVREPQRAGGDLTPGPRIFVARNDWPEDLLPDSGWRTVLVRLAEGQELSRVSHELRTAFGEAGVKTYQEAGQRLQAVYRSIGNYLSLVATLSLLLGMLGVAAAVRAEVADRQVEVAVLRTIGFSPGAVWLRFMAQVALVGLIGSLIGAGFGLLGRRLLLASLSSLLPLPPSGGAVLVTTAAEGIAVGSIAALVTAWLPLRRLQLIEPVQILRSSMGAESATSWGHRLRAVPILVAVGGALVILVGRVVGDLAVAAVYLALLGLLMGAMRLGSSLIFRALRRIRPPGSATATLALRNLARIPGVTPAAAGLAMSSFLLAVLYLFQAGLLAEIGAAGAQSDIPNLYLLGVPQEQRQALRRTLAESPGVERVEAPQSLAQGRLTAVDQRPVADGAGGSVSLASATPRLAMGRMVAGRWFQEEDEAKPVLVVRQSEAESLGLSLHSEVTMELGNRLHVFEVIGIWDPSAGGGATVGVNVPFMTSPGYLDEFADLYIVSSRVDLAALDEIVDAVLRVAPGTIPLSLDEVVRMIGDLLGRVSQLVRVIAGTSLVSGIVAVVGAMAANRQAKRREASLLRVLGIGTRQVRALQLLEGVMLGFFSGLLGGLTAWGLTALVSALVAPEALSTGLGAGVALAAGGGLGVIGGGVTFGVTWNLFRDTPLQVLRSE